MTIITVFLKHKYTYVKANSKLQGMIVAIWQIIITLSVANPWYACVKDAWTLIWGIGLNVSHITPPLVVHITAGTREGQDETREMKADVIRIPKGP